MSVDFENIFNFIENKICIQYTRAFWASEIDDTIAIYTTCLYTLMTSV